MRTDYHSYMEDITDLASSYNREDCTYDAAMCRCREIARTYMNQWEWTAADFDVACIELKRAERLTS